MSNDNGGPAFPYASSMSLQPTGMTMRDYFAGQAITLMRNVSAEGPTQAAFWAYEVADAMLAERNTGTDT